MSEPSWVRRLERSSLHRQYRLVIVLVIGVLLATALICSVTVVWASSHVQTTEQRVAALQVVNRDLLQQMTEAQNGVLEAVSGSAEDGRERYGDAAASVAADEARLRRLARGEQSLLDALAAQERADAAWFDGFAEPQLSDGASAGGGARRGGELFAAARTANASVSARIDAVTADIREDSRTLLGLALAAVVVLPLGVMGLVAVVLHRAGESVMRPLTHVSGVLERLRAGDVEARADVEGPQEIRQIAQALNSLTDENVRASEVEADVLSQLESIDRVRTDLVSTVSHELRTPLTSIRGYLELLEDDLGEGLSTQQAAMMGVIRRNLERLNELITNLLALSRAEETQLAVEQVDLRAVTAEVTADVRLQAAARDIVVRTVQAAAGVVVLGDRSQLIRAVQNLVTNAVKFSRPGGIVEVRVRQDGREAVVEVVDEGIGIPQADLAGLGSRFYRGSNAMKAEIAGTGLGLRIVQTILDRHEGTLSVESVEGEGATFTVRLPVGADEEAPASYGAGQRVEASAP